MSDRKMTRREFLRLSAIVSSAGFLAACGVPPATPSPTQSASQSTSPTGAPPPAAAGGSTKLTISYPDELGAKPKYVNAAVDAFKAKHPNVEVVVDLQKIPDEQYIPKLLLAMGAGDAPDIFHIGGTNMGGLVDANFIAPLDQYLASWSDWQYFYDSIKQAVKYNGKSWCIPYGLDTRFLYYRKDVFQQAGLNPDWAPKSLDDIVTAA